MTKPRSQQISLADTPYYHCVSRCVRRAYLCGKDSYSGKCYEHRRAWVEQRIHLLSTAYSIKVCAYAVMSNHTHLVLAVDEPAAQQWSDKEVLVRWHTLHSGTLLTQKYLQNPKSLAPFEYQTLNSTIQAYRQRLSSISWFMRDLNEVIARQANLEDNCTGRFWEGRYKCQALLNDTALLACMAYVDLNPIRANMAATPEQSTHTSIFQRIAQNKQRTQPKYLMPFTGQKKDTPNGLPFELTHYLELVRYSAQAQRSFKQEKMLNIQPSLLIPLEINQAQWLSLTATLEQQFSGAIGKPHQIKQFQDHQDYQRYVGISSATKWLSTA
jgi:REP element-mobilizing transposase RayT